jgi:hypothetical protein
MPFEIKDKRTKKVKACAVVGNTLLCGHCQMPVKDQHRWFAIDDPYFCLIHETCLTLFEFDEKDRMSHTEGSENARKTMDAIVKTLYDMTGKRWFHESRMLSTDRKRALQQMLMIYQSLRTAAVINDGHIDRAMEAMTGFANQDWFKATPEEQQKAIRAIVAVHHANRNAEAGKEHCQVEAVVQDEKVEPKPFYFKKK